MNKPIGWREVPVLPVVSAGSEDNRKEIVDYLVKAGAQAPSWYNCQPWHFQVHQQCINVLLDNSRDQSFYNWGNFNALLACGAAIKNILIAAKGRGVGAEVVFLPEGPESLFLAKINLQFEKKVQPTETDLAMERAVWTRHTNTLFFDNKPLAENQLNSLRQAIPLNSGVSLYLLNTEEDKQKVFAAASCAEQIRFSRRDLHEQLHRMIRWNDEQAYANKTGYTLPSMGACGFGKTFFRITRPWIVMRLMNFFGADKNQAKRACEGLRHCGAIGLLVVNGYSQQDLLQGGQTIQQLWLTVAGLDLDLQPHNSLPQFLWARKVGGDDLFNRKELPILDDAFKSFTGVFPDIDHSSPGTAVFLFRVGKGLSVKGYTLRMEIA